MKALRMFCRVGVVVALLGLSTAMADIESVRTPLTFSLDTGDGSVSMPDVSFDTMGGVGSDDAQTTCAMTPGGTASPLLLEEPMTQAPTPEPAMSSPQVALAPLNSLRGPPSPPGSTGLNYPPRYAVPNPPVDSSNPSVNPPVDPLVSPSVVPEPTTLLLVGLGVGVALVMRRRRNAV